MSNNRFGNVSKYRNSVIAPTKKQGPCTVSPAGISDPPIKCSLDYVAYRSGITSIQLLPLPHSSAAPFTLSPGACARDLDFSPFTLNNLQPLAVGCEDGSIKIFHGESLVASLSTELKLPVDNVAFNGAAQSILAASCGNQLQVWNVDTQKLIASMDVGDVIQSLSWTFDGAKLVTIAKDNFIALWDPRASDPSQPLSKGTAHSGIKPSRVVCLKDNQTILTTGFNQRREREYCVWESHDLTKPLSTTRIDTSTGILAPLYDPDTDLVFLVGKGDANVRWMQAEGSKVQEFPQVSIGNSIMGACLIPKRACQIMEGEIDRIMVITANGNTIMPVSVIVPRRSYADFHADIFPDTSSDVSNVKASEWESGVNKMPDLISLNPNKAKVDVVASTLMKTTLAPSEPVAIIHSTSTDSLPTRTQTLRKEAVAAESPKPVRTLSLPRSSQYRFLEGKTQSQFEDLKNLNSNNSNETNGFEVNHQFLAFALAGAGGRIGIWSTLSTGRLPVKIPSIICGSDLCDFKFDPFNNCRIVTGTEDGRIRIWTIPVQGLNDDLGDPTDTISAHSNRVSLLEFHPFASNVLLTASPEQGTPLVKIWNLETKEVISVLKHPDHVLGAAFSADGSKVATAGRDKTVRVFDARSGDLLHSGTSHEGIKACRVLWLGDTGRICTVGFGKANAREIRVYDANDVSKLLGSATVGTSPSLIVPAYDRDTGLIALVGRGDSFVQFYEITDAHVPQLANRFDGPPPQQSLQFLPKRHCDVKAIEILVGYRLTSSSIEKISFTVPRLHKDYFQDDIYVSTIDVEKPALKASQWVQGDAPVLVRIDLKPENMLPLSSRTVAQTEKKVVSVLREVTEQEKKEAAMKAMFAQAQQQDNKLEQDSMEGVDPDEWVRFASY